MKKITVLLLLTIVQFAYTQKLKVAYNYYYKVTDSPVSLLRPSELRITNESSIYEIFINPPNTVPTETLSHGSDYVIINENKNRFYYKDLKKKTVTGVEKILTKEFIVSDSLAIFNWELLTDETKEILGHICNKAKLNYRGRKYEAYYTTDIPIQNGPYKFHGLPGLILEIKTNDPSLDFKITATSISSLDTLSKMNNPFADKKPISWEEYTVIYSKKYEELKSYSGDDNVTLSIPKGKIEIIVN